METVNQTKVAEFILEGFPSLQHFHKPLFLLLLLIYLFTISGNLLIFTIIRTDPQLHTPMYFFVSILSFLEIWYTAATIPKMLSNMLSKRRNISFTGCLLQIYFFHSLGATECYLLTVMAFDRYLAICNPLRYPAIMTSQMCIKLAASCWICGLLGPITEIVLISKLPFCGPNQIKHIFCDFPPVLSLACTDTSVNILVDFVVNACKILATFLLILLSYLQIIRAIVKIRTAAGRRKAFSTCAAHLTVVLIFFGSILFMYVRLTKSYSLDYDRALAVVYAIITPFLNPIIYSLRNKEIKAALKRMFWRQKTMAREREQPRRLGS
ncbi:olfactory receptor 6N1-like [Tiliqua scincoides]|uniref:olfactory receptor 6N1-like n=1 Tax=Tiliqua scincoides TaxID=71010 RepID=UPI0034621B3A